MNKISLLFPMLNPCRTIFFVLLFCSGLAAQSGIELDIRMQSADESVRGGETLRYTVRVTNSGTAAATGVILVQATRTLALPAVSMTGDCRLIKELSRMQNPFRCDIGSLGPNQSAVVNFELQIIDLGGEEMSPAQIDSMRAIGEAMTRTYASDGQARSDGTSVVADIYVRAAESEENLGNNNVDVLTRLLPSLNLPPRVKILSPASNSELKRRVNGKNEVVLNIEAYDPDGEIVKLVVSDPAFSPLNNLFVEDGVRKIRVDGKVYTAEEYDGNPKLSEYFQRTAKKIGKNLYSYSLNNLRFGPNTIFVHALDNQGRTGLNSVHFDVAGDAEVKISSPDPSRVFRPGSTIEIETTSTIDDPDLRDMRIDGTQVGFAYITFGSMPLAEILSTSGKTVRHRYVWQDAAEGIYRLRVNLGAGEQRTNAAGQLVVVAKPRVIKIVSLKTGQEFRIDEPIKIIVDATDERGQVVSDKLELVIDGKRRREITNARRMSDSQSYKDALDMNSFYTLSDLGPGKHTLQVVAKHSDLHTEGPILGESEIITIVVK